MQKSDTGYMSEVWGREMQTCRRSHVYPTCRERVKPISLVDSVSDTPFPVAAMTDLFHPLDSVHAAPCTYCRL